MDNKTNVSWPGWETTRLIDRGSFGAVYEIQREIRGRVEHAALKVISIPRDDIEIQELKADGYDDESITQYFTDSLEKIEDEYAMMADLKGHSNVVYCDDIRTVQHDNGFGWDIYIKMELLTPLKSHLTEKATEAQVIKLGVDICDALKLCEELNIVHRDIKPENIFVSRNGSYKLGDFGIAKTMEGTTGGTKTGTYDYMAPEVYNNRPYHTQADIYSLGLVMYWLLNNRTAPFLPQSSKRPTPSAKMIARDQRFSGEEIPAPKNGSEELKRIVLKACAFDPKDRYQSAREMREDLLRLSGEHVYEPVPETKPIPPTPDPDDDPHNKTYGPDFKRKTKKGKNGGRSGPMKDLQGEKLLLWMFVFGIIFIILLSLLYLTRWTGTDAETDVPNEGSLMESANYEEQNEHVHMWVDATCTTAKSCYTCGAVSGDALGHQWVDATCTTPKSCYTCGAVSGSALGHQWVDATYDAPKTCVECGKIVGTALERSSQLSVPAEGMIAAGNYHSVRLYPDGTVFAVGRNKLSEDDNRGTRLDVSTWTDIVAISASSHTVGLKSDGTVVACGVNGYGQCDLSDWSDIVAISAGDEHTVGLRSDGTVVAKGNNEYGQCDVSHWKNIIAIAASQRTTFGLKADGTIISAGQRNYGYTWKNITSICAGTYDLVGLRNDGTVVAAGSSDNWDSNTLTQWGNIVEISASSTHIVGLKADGTVVACGLERAAEACEIDKWRDIVQVSAGMYFTIGLKSDGTIVSVGENFYNQLDLG